MSPTAQTLPLPPLPADLAFLDVVTEWDDSVSFQDWKPQMLVPATFRPVTAPRTFVLANQKGGAAKTTSTVELAAAWAAMGYRVLVIDSDPQRAALSAWLLPVYPEGLAANDRRNLRHVFFGEATLAQAAYPTMFQRVYVVPSGTRLGLVEAERPVGAETCLRAQVEAVRDQFDLVLIDAGPTLGLLTIAAMVAADDVIIPTVPGGLDIKGVDDLHDTITLVRDRLNPKLDVRAVLLSSWEKTMLAREMGSAMAGRYPNALVAPIRRSVRVGEAPNFGEPTRLYEPTANPVRDFDQAARLILPRSA
ncbi:ParA family protein [Streptomyces sp. NPDC059810]|uniref:ParA family protein n=1 Tax=Streptomyces sp. NPDC059810 TaxID=3346956 RepID=UPI003660B216